jgi:glycosyltransferase involved in cell wall biosynthesis
MGITVMNIFIDARGLENRIDGIGQFTLQILNRLPYYDKAYYSVLIRDDLHKVLLTGSHILPSAPHINYIKTEVRRFSIGEGHKLNSLIKQLKPNLYFNTSPYISGNFSCMRLMILYDLLSTHFKGHFRGMGLFKEFLARRYFRYQTRKSIRRADGIITISNHSKKNIGSHYRVDGSRISVVYGGVDKQYDFPIDEGKKQEFMSKYNLGGKYFLHVGNLKPYKNITGIIKAYDYFVRKYPESNIRFVFTCNHGRGHDDAIRLIRSLQLDEKITMIGYLDAQDMPILYTSSLGLFLPSLEEGEGLPVLEAMCCKTPVVTSRGTATEEIAGGHAFLVDPHSIPSLVEGLEYLAFTQKDPDKINKAYAHAKEFTWDKAVDSIMQLLLKK